MRRGAHGERERAAETLRTVVYHAGVGALGAS